MTLTRIQKRFAMFLGGCIPVRVIFVILAYMLARNKIKFIKNNKKFLRILGYLALLPAIGFFSIYSLGLSKSGPETQGNKIYWNYMRPIHGFFYLLFALCALSNNNYYNKISYIFLLIDVIIGLLTFILHHYKNNNFKKIF